MAYEEAIKDLEQLKQSFYDLDINKSLCGSLNMAIEALEKMTPTKPNWIYEDEPMCPNCGEIMDDGENPCECCNQLIDWSE